MYFHVRPQRAWIRAVKLTLLAFVRLFSSQAAISWRASGNRQISLNASVERAFANFRDKKTLYFTIANFRNKNVVFYTFLQQKRFFLQFFATKN